MNFLKNLSKYRDIILIILDCLCIAFSYYIGAVILQDSLYNFSAYYVNKVIYTSLVYILIYEIIFHITKRHKNIITYNKNHKAAYHKTQSST